MWKFKPKLKQTLWGGERIISFKHLESPLTKVGESWEVSGICGDESVIANGEEEGTTLTQLLESKKETLVGVENYRRFGNTFPLLVKFIDAREALSVQVHPDDKQAKARYGKRGKTEMWYVVEAGEHAYLHVGFSQLVTPEEFDRRVSEGTLTEVLGKYTVRSGDVFYLPAGRVHSIGAGCFIAEIQETSDLTYRIFDFNRRDAQGHFRALHLAEAKEVIDYSAFADYQTHYKAFRNERSALVNCSYFTTNLYELDAEIETDYSNLDSFVLWMGLEGYAELLAGNQSINLQAGETLLLPATTGKVRIRPEGKAKFLEIYI